MQQEATSQEGPAVPEPRTQEERSTGEASVTSKRDSSFTEERSVSVLDCPCVADNIFQAQCSLDDHRAENVIGRIPWGGGGNGFCSSGLLTSAGHF